MEPKQKTDDINKSQTGNGTSVPAPIESKRDELFSDEKVVGLSEEILLQIREDRKGIDEVLVNFINMVINEGDASTASKEALVNLLKLKSDTAGHMSKVLDQMVRIKLRDKSIPPYIAEKINEDKPVPRRKLIEALAKENKKEQ